MCDTNIKFDILIRANDGHLLGERLNVVLVLNIHSLTLALIGMLVLWLLRQRRQWSSLSNG